MVFWTVVRVLASVLVAIKIAAPSFPPAQSLSTSTCAIPYATASWNSNAQKLKDALVASNVARARVSGIIKHVEARKKYWMAISPDNKAKFQHSNRNRRNQLRSKSMKIRSCMMSSLVAWKKRLIIRSWKNSSNSNLQLRRWARACRKSKRSPWRSTKTHQKLWRY